MSWWKNFRNKLGTWLIDVPAAPETQEVIHQRRRLALYSALSGLTIGESICMLNDVVREQIVTDPALNAAHAQSLAPDLAAIAGQMNPQDFIFLASSAIDHVATKSLSATPSVRTAP